MSDRERERLWDIITSVRDGAPRVANDASTDDIIDAIIDSGWLHEHDRQVRRGVTEEIAQAIEAGSSPIDNSRYVQRFRDAQIAREIGGRDE